MNATYLYIYIYTYYICTYLKISYNMNISFYTYIFNIKSKRINCTYERTGIKTGSLEFFVEL